MRYLSRLFILSLGVLAFAGSAFASDDLPAKRLASELAALYLTGYSPCPTKADPGINEFIFAFEGGGGYSKSYFAFNFRDPRTGFEGEDLFKTQPEAKWSTERRRLYRTYEILQKQNLANAALIEAIDYVSSNLSSRVPKKVLYYPWNASGAAALCAAKVKRLYSNAKLPLSISSVGFSLGGYATVLFNRFLNWQGIRLKNVLTLDPVPFTHELSRALRDHKNNTVISVPDNHGSWINLYQEKDVNTLAELLPIHGARLRGKVTNLIPLGLRGAPVDEHMWIPFSAEATSELTRILSD
jgi:hypothetical protein